MVTFRTFQLFQDFFSILEEHVQKCNQSFFKDFLKKVPGIFGISGMFGMTLIKTPIRHKVFLVFLG